jgi:hypothetical protein
MADPSLLAYRTIFRIAGILTAVRNPFISSVFHREFENDDQPAKFSATLAGRRTSHQTLTDSEKATPRRPLW